MSSIWKINVRGFPELDSIRFIAVTMVVLHHQFFRDNPVLNWFADHGFAGVDIFFTLSGFIITYGLFRESERSGTISLKNFWIRRIFRLWPSWLLALSASAAMVFFMARKNPELMATFQWKAWHYFFHFGNYSYGYLGKLHDLFGHYWSLAVEEHFYVLWPAAFFLTLKNLRNRYVILALLIIIPYLLRVYHMSIGDPENVAKLSTHTRFDALAFGCLFAHYFKILPDLKGSLEWVVTLLMFGYFILGLHILPIFDFMPWVYQLYSTCISLGTCMLMWIAIKGGPNGLRRLLQFKFIARLGVLSYGVYLFHMHTNYVSFALMGKLIPQGLDQNVNAILHLIYPYIPAYLVFVFVDGFFEKFKKRFY